MTRTPLARKIPALINAVAVCTIVALGPAAANLIHYRVSPGALAQYIGCEPITLFAGLTLAWIAFSSSQRGSLLGVGAGTYIIYTMVTVVFGQDYSRYDGNGELFFPLIVVVTASALFTVVECVSELVKHQPLAVSRRHRVMLFVLGTMFAFMWISTLAQGNWDSNPEYQADPTLFWLVKYLDLSVIIPTALVSAFVWRGTYRVAGMCVLAFSGWMTLAIAGMQIAMIALEFSPVGALIVAGVMLAAASVAAWLIFTLKEPVERHN